MALLKENASEVNGQAIHHSEFFTKSSNSLKNTIITYININLSIINLSTKPADLEIKYYT